MRGERVSVLLLAPTQLASWLAVPLFRLARRTMPTSSTQAGHGGRTDVNSALCSGMDTCADVFVRTRSRGAQCMDRALVSLFELLLNLSLIFSCRLITSSTNGFDGSMMSEWKSEYLSDSSVSDFIVDGLQSLPTWESYFNNPTGGKVLHLFS
jgi:hypothetical protein